MAPISAAMTKDAGVRYELMEVFADTLR